MIGVGTFSELSREIAGSIPGLSPFLAQKFVNRAFRDVRESRLWSWNVAETALLAPAQLTTGTVSVTQYSATVTADAAAATAWQGLGMTIPITSRQFRVGTGPLYNISAFDGNNTITLDRIYGAATAIGAAYNIYKAYYAGPGNLLRWTSIVDPTNNYYFSPKNLHWTREEVDRRDPFRGALGTPIGMASYKLQTSAGAVGAPFQVRGSGPAPGASGPYIGGLPATYTVEVTTGGIGGAAVFKWKLDQGSYTTGVTSTVVPQDLSLGLRISWPAALTFVLGDVFTIAATPGAATGAAMFEMWPHPTAAVAYLAIYQTRGSDLVNPTDSLPPTVPDELIVYRGLYHAYHWAEANVPKPAIEHRVNWPGLWSSAANNYQQLLKKAAIQDEETYLQMYGNYVLQEDAFRGPLTGKYLQSHDGQGYDF